MINKYNQENLCLTDIKTKNDCIFVCCASFEERSTSFAMQIDSKSVLHCYAFFLDGYEKTLNSIKTLQDKYEEKIDVIQLCKSDIFSTYKEITRVITKIREYDFSELIVDISTFTHETLLVLLHIINKSSLTVKFVYLGANKYSIGDDNEHKWLSKGCKNIRNILGYPGMLNPNWPICLTVLVGFEHERAMGLIYDMDPELIMLGNGITEKNHVTAEEHIAPMKFFEDMYNSLLISRTSVNSFSFSAKDLDLTINEIKKTVLGTKRYNHVIAPLNTKISTLAIGILALEHPEIQVCYAEPEIYNVNEYSTPSNNVSIITVEFIS